MKIKLLVASATMLSLTGAYCLLIDGATEPTKESDLSVSSSNVMLVSSSAEMGEILFQEGYVYENCNILAEPNLNSDIVATYEFNQTIMWCEYLEDNNWVIVDLNGKFGYLEKKNIFNSEYPYKIIEIPNYSGFKSWEDYRCITMTSSMQYKLQQYAETNDLGIREVDGRYCIAVGNGTGCQVGDYIDLILNNDTIIPCIVGDIKDNSDTDSSNLITTHSDCCSEFIVYEPDLHSSAKSSGNISQISDDWDSRVVKIKRYKKNFFN